MHYMMNQTLNFAGGGNHSFCLHGDYAALLSLQVAQIIKLFPLKNAVFCSPFAKATLSVSNWGLAVFGTNSLPVLLLLET